VEEGTCTSKLTKEEIFEKRGAARFHGNKRDRKCGGHSAKRRDLQGFVKKERKKTTLCSGFFCSMGTLYSFKGGDGGGWDP